MNAIAPSPQDLTLDAGSLSPEELSMPTLVREIGLRRRPNAILRRLMNSLEDKRQSRGMGWSRPWNKHGLTIFRSHRVSLVDDPEHFAPLSRFLEPLVRDMPDSDAAFARELLADPACMAFVFYHNNDCVSGQFEGLTLSFGRKNAEDKTKRDRVDIILEDERVDGRVDGQVDRFRVYVCPWSRYQNHRKHTLIERRVLSADEADASRELYQNAVRFYHQWKGVEDRQWIHWSQQYIDYFGPRAFIPVGTSFS